MNFARRTRLVFFIPLLLLGGSLTAQASKIKCGVTSSAKLIGKYLVCVKSGCVDNQAAAELVRTYLLEIDDSLEGTENPKVEDQIKFSFEDTANDWVVTQNAPFENKNEILGAIQFGTTSKESQVRAALNDGLARIRIDRKYPENIKKKIPEIHVADYAYGTWHGSRKVVGGGLPSRFEFKDPNTKGIFEFQHEVSVDCPAGQPDHD